MMERPKAEYQIDEAIRKLHRDDKTVRYIESTLLKDRGYIDQSILIITLKKAKTRRRCFN